MKKIGIYMCIAAAMVATSSCSSEEPAEQPTQTPAPKTTITASTGTADTRISFKDEDQAGMKLTWSAGDEIAFYDADGRYAALFILEGEGGSSIGEFSSLYEAELTPGATYTVVYPAPNFDARPLPTLTERTKIISGRTQTGNEGTGHLDAQNYMTANYTHSEGDANVISFVHDYTMITVKMDPPADYTHSEENTPVSLTFTNGNSSTLVSFDDGSITQWDATHPIKAYMMIAPCEAESRTLQFDLVCKDGSTYHKEFTSTKAYEAGMRYTADLTGENRLIASTAAAYSLETLESIPSELKIWVITDIITHETDLSSLKTAIDNSNGNIHLILPEATGIKEQAFYQCEKLAYINLPKATSIGRLAFAICTNLAYISLPKATSIGYGAFTNCRSLTHINLPEATSIGSAAFANCRSLTHIRIPKTTSIGDEVFCYCHDLTSLEIGTASNQELASVGTNLFKTFIPINVTLTIGTAEAARSDVNKYTKKWRGYSLFKSIQTP